MKFYLPFFVVIMMCTMLLSAVHSEEVAEPTLVIEMLNKRDKEKMLYSDELVRVEVGEKDGDHGFVAAGIIGARCE